MFHLISFSQHFTDHVSFLFPSVHSQTAVNSDEYRSNPVVLLLLLSLYIKQEIRHGVRKKVLVCSVADLYLLIY